MCLTARDDVCMSRLLTQKRQNASTFFIHRIRDADLRNFMVRGTSLMLNHEDFITSMPQ